MNKIYLLVVYCLFIVSAFGQGGTWTWISGSKTLNDTGVYGTQGVPSVYNYPPGVYEPCEWKDRQGNFWIYGGTHPSNSDLWKYDPINNEWTWVKGNGLPNLQPVYGTQGIANPINSPGQRSWAAATWVDTSGVLWLFGGGFDDLWKYEISSNEWTWLNGDTSSFAKGVHGVKGIPSASNTPGARNETCSAWTDSLNNLWLFGGYGIDDNGTYGILNDLCKYDINTNEWTWMSGASLSYSPSNYGVKGISTMYNCPGARMSYTKWKDKSGNFWLMGGDSWHPANDTSWNDVWEYNLKMNEWTWMNGTNIPSDGGNYQTYCLFSGVNLPYSRMEQKSSVTDNCGRFWLFGGAKLTYPFICLNDFWVFDPNQLKWNLISGTNMGNQPGSYGILGVSSLSNMPPSRGGAAAWWGDDNKLYMFGGAGHVGIYADLWVFNPDTNCVPSCNAGAVLKPTASFQSSDTTLCYGSCINFTDLSTNNPTSWQWHFAGAIDSISTDQNPQSICYLASGTYNVTLIASNSGGSDTITEKNFIIVFPLTPVPTVTQSHDTLFCRTEPSYLYYQWYDSSTAIPGAIDTFYVFTQTGNYNIQVTDTNCCTIAVGTNIYPLSAKINASHTAGANGTCKRTVGIKTFTDEDMVSLYPNPTGDKLYVNGYRLSGKTTCAIYNVLGEVVLRSPLLWRGTGGEANVSSLSPGIYFVQLTNEKESWVGRFVKE